MVVFVENDYDNACDVCDDLNKELFGLTEEEAFLITNSTMKSL